LKSFTAMLLIIFLVGLINLLPGVSESDSNLTSIHQTDLEVHLDSLSEDTLVRSDSSYRSIDEEQADQVRVFVNTTLIIIIIAILILALTIFLIINRVRRTTAE
jgi:hypothetical protein